MADPKYNESSALYMSALKKLAQRTDSRLDAVESASGSAFKSLNVSGNTVSFYTTTDKSGTAAASFDFPAEYFLDQSKTTLVADFHWTAEAYPGSTNPSHDDINLEGKPVFVLAVKDNAASPNVTYSFADMNLLVDTYKAKQTGKDGSTTITFSGYELEVKVNISDDDDNILTTDSSGKLKVPKTDITGKADKVAGDGAKTDEILTADANGNIQASGKKVGGATLAASPDANTAATEAAVSAAISGQATATASSGGTGGAKGLMSPQDKEKLDGIVFATDAEVDAMLDEVYGTASNG